jgi:hypothetical protein
MHQIAKGLAMGYAADQLMAYRYEEDWSKPVAEWRKELRLVAEQEFEFVAHSRAQSDPASADADAEERLVP